MRPAVVDFSLPVPQHLRDHAPVKGGAASHHAMVGVKVVVVEVFGVVEHLELRLGAVSFGDRVDWRLVTGPAAGSG